MTEETPAENDDFEPLSDAMKDLARKAADGIVGAMRVYKFAEPAKNWEAFVSGKRGMERQNLGYTYDAIRRLKNQLGAAPDEDDSI